MFFTFSSAKVEDAADHANDHLAIGSDSVYLPPLEHKTPRGEDNDSSFDVVAKYISRAIIMLIYGFYTHK